MSRIYTKKGDNGNTKLYDYSNPFTKDDPIFEVLGDLDELSCHIGKVIIQDIPDDIKKFLRGLQLTLLNIGSDLSCRKSRKIREINMDDVKILENYIDEYTEKTPPLREFILPGSNMTDCEIHLCRAVCRRMERHLWGVKNKQTQLELKTKDETFMYINRLSDYFFALARYLSSIEITRSKANQDL